uniref:Uncharacterized protein n=1 Tax=Rhizophora mucronata TaxID=61149 RepID=A0A2P2NQ22_RHIMU
MNLHLLLFVCSLGSSVGPGWVTTP